MAGTWTKEMNEALMRNLSNKEFVKELNATLNKEGPLEDFKDLDNLLKICKELTKRLELRELLERK